MLQGRCLCEGVQYRVDGPVKYASHCYCSMCQRQHGAAAGSYANVASADLRYTQGAELVTEYASSDEGRRGFCRVCGSSLTWRSTAHPDRIAVALGTMNPPYDGPVQHELYPENKPGWVPGK
jgi:hypothetical protein